MSYSIKLSDTAKENLGVLEKKIVIRVFNKLESIREDPFKYVKRLKGVPLFSLRIGDYRIVMDIKTNQLLILVMRIGHRSKIYDNV